MDRLHFGLHGARTALKIVKHAVIALIEFALVSSSLLESLVIESKHHFVCSGSTVLKYLHAVPNLMRAILNIPSIFI